MGFSHSGALLVKLCHTIKELIFANIIVEWKSLMLIHIYAVFACYIAYA